MSEISDIFSNISELIEKVSFSKSLSTETKEKITDLIFKSKKNNFYTRIWKWLRTKIDLITFRKTSKRRKEDKENDQKNER